MGIKISPVDDMGDTASPYEETSATYAYLIDQCVARNLGYIALSRRGYNTRNRPAGTKLPTGYDPLNEFGPMIKFPGSRTRLMVNFEYTVGEAERLLKEGKIDLVAFGHPFIYNPVCTTILVYLVQGGCTKHTTRILSLA